MEVRGCDRGNGAGFKRGHRLNAVAGDPTQGHD